MVEFKHTMETVTFELFRIRLFEGLFTPSIPRSEILLNAISERPQTENKGYTWSIGNISLIDRNAAYFRIGRQSGINLSNFDRSLGQFTDSTSENWPSTHVICDTYIGLVAIAKNSKLTVDTYTIARRVKEILENSETIKEAYYDVVIDPIYSSNDFMKQLEFAYSIRRFAFEFTPPNPFDAEEMIQKPLEKYLQDARGRKGELSLEGNNLDHEVIEETARSAIASGNEVKAMIQQERAAKPIPISSKDYPEAIRDLPIDGDNQGSIARALEVIRNIYSNLRLG
ncbi:hypothetical protein [Deinococcus maricopensis]|uniref:Uncharacterized protein n=1 Tax=Deinococcus maricopensis (strain DSM 21211 / LMG 22137 / NRRL B-23946 / LB-34) TaxID=709986 RepID=E8U5T1_DEIML|nr:hypothetical protein [Deinococcus maricopensis]ADV66420.1 hypothetical protein Deima_0764 [Deinococcus maricopensis DSM 21211]